MDIVDYSKLLIHKQSELQRQLNEIVRGTDLICTGFFKTNETVLFLQTGGQSALLGEQYADQLKMKPAFSAGEKMRTK